jgi:3-hydroxyisobutyrate dehydrogenase
MTSSPTRCGMIGLGNMGGRIARRIRDAGFPISGFDTNQASSRHSGIDQASSIGALVRAADVVLFSLPDSHVVERVVHGGDGVLASCSSGQTIVDLTTAAPTSTAALHREFAARGVEYVDAGISGGAPAAEAGTLAIMAGGSATALSSVGPVLECFSANVYHMGGTGAGHATKLLNNFLMGAALAATAEAVVCARKAGLDLSQFLDVVNHSTGVNFFTRNRFPDIVEGRYPQGGLSTKLAAKDLLLYLEYGKEIGIVSLTGSACLGAFNLATHLGYGDEVSYRLVDAIGDVAGGIRLVEAPSGEGGDV